MKEQDTKLPVYKITIDGFEDDDELGLHCVSLVDAPAIERNFEYFANKQRFEFDSDRHIVKGPALIPDMRIYRFSPIYGEYEVVFDADTIAKLVEKYATENKLNLIDVNHDGEITDKMATCIESFIVSDDTKYKDYPNGTWIVAYKIHDEQLWGQIKANDVRGFSVEVTANLERVLFRKAEKTEKTEKSENGEQSFDEFVDDLLFSLDLTAAMDFCINHRPVMIKYLSVTQPPATGYRQGFIECIGYTKAGNLAMRFCQIFGDSASIRREWKIMLLDQVLYCRELTEAVDWSYADLLHDWNPVDDESLNSFGGLICKA